MSNVIRQRKSLFQIGAIAGLVDTVDGVRQYAIRLCHLPHVSDMTIYRIASADASLVFNVPVFFRLLREGFGGHVRF